MYWSPRVAPALLLFTAGLIGQGPPALVDDLNTVSYRGLASNPVAHERASLGIGTTVFVASDPLHGVELWKTDGTAAGTSLVKDIVPGPASSHPRQLSTFYASPPQVLFVASDGNCGDELWRTDGTAAGTYLLEDIYPGASGSSPANLIVVLGSTDILLYFSADDGSHGRELWKSDGTAAGTVLVRDTWAGASSGMTPTSPIQSFSPVEDVGVAFTANNGVAGEELWTYVSGIASLHDIRPGPPGSVPRDFEESLGVITLLFSADDGTHGRELWRLNSSTVTLVQDINPGAASSGPSDFRYVTAGVIVFAATDPNRGRELWRYNATTQSAALVRDIEVGAAGSFPNLMFQTPLSGVIFSANRSLDGRELWVTDGTAAGTTLLADIQPGPASSTPAFVGRVVSSTAVYRCLFAADDGSRGTELWISDATPAGTVRVSDIAPGAGGSQPYGLGVIDNARFLFAADDGVHGTEPWITDGSSAGTMLLRDVAVDPGSSAPRDLTALDGSGTLCFTADDGSRGRELWRTEGTGRTTALVKDIRPGAAGSDVQALFAHGGRLFFAASDGASGLELWVSDGTTAGTAMLADIRPGSVSSAPRDFIALTSRTVCFVADDGSSGRELWKTDGTTAGTVLLADVHPGVASSSPASLVVMGSTLYFSARTAAEGRELWKSDGTTAGTVLIRDINPGPADSAASAHELFVYGSLLLFDADDGIAGSELWRSDGTTPGTVLVRNLSTTDASPGGFCAMNGLVYFAADAPLSGRELFKTDGTFAGTIMVRDIAPNLPSSSPRALTAVNGRLLFAAETPATGLELWASDGSLAGTVMVEDINPGCGDGIWESTTEPLRFYTRNGASRVVLAASNGSAGVEPWVSDGTAAGTALHADVNPGAASSNPRMPVLAGKQLFFAASHATTGLELYAKLSMAAWSTFGVACHGSFGLLPQIAASGTPVLGNTGFRVLVRDALRNSAAVLEVGFGAADLPIGGGCRLHVDLFGPSVALTAPTDARGDAAFDLPIPRDANLVGLRLFAQAPVLDPGGAFARMLSMTSGLEMVLAID